MAAAGEVQHPAALLCILVLRIIQAAAVLSFAYPVGKGELPFPFFAVYFTGSPE